MAFSPQGGTVTPPAAPIDPTKPNDLASLLIAAGAIPARSPLDRGAKPHFTFHTCALRAQAANSGTISFGFGRADQAALSAGNAAGFLAKSDGFTIDAVNGVAALEAVFVIGNGTDTLTVAFWE